MEDTFNSYMLSTNYSSQKLVKYVDGLTHYLGKQYEDLPLDQKEKLIDDFVVDPEIRALYTDPSGDVDSKNERKCSFPRYTYQTGEKIVVDCENDFSTWRDEHSGPFSWKSLSQQNLTLDDLEPNKITKPLSKHLPEIPAPPEEFPVQTESWSISLISDYKSKANQIPTGTDRINKAFDGSIQNVSQASPAIVRPQLLKPESVEKVNKPVAPKRHVKKSPVSPNDDSHAADRLLPKSNEESGAFSNPTMTVNYSTFIGQEEALDDEKDHSIHSVAMTTRNKDDDDNTHDKFSVEESQTDDDDFESNFQKQEVDSGNEMLSETMKSGFDFLDQW